MPAHAILRRCGEIGLVGGQEDMIIDVAIQLAAGGGVVEQFGHVIDGREESDGATFDSVDPWTREPWATVALGGAAEADRAVTAARRAFDEGPWPRMGFAERGALIHRFADLLVEHLEWLALADTRDMGKPISDARGKDVPRAAQNFRFFADHARLATAETLPMDTGHHAYTRYEPAGVVAAIAPWNFPLMLESWKVAPALAWGNTVVLKPAEDTPGVGDDHGPARAGGGHPAGRVQRAARLRARTRRARRSPRTAGSTGSRSPASRTPGGPSPARPRATSPR